ncbi:hypothetical protein FEM48_Zijuj09G0139200 [Ziziphus jujuba var. spinosa]|uniref:Serine carboxypeptidase-like 18 n=1 Tax=Ziziphus jujuba var. spinosa TaxID=714518 RepID=A0A978UTD0_ZIZJJ|nr:hypothetical protein FEM48_Zijuj09G0139200 [Ziziphus jujuba var. spinosa]
MQQYLRIYGEHGLNLTGKCEILLLARTALTYKRIRVANIIFIDAPVGTGFSYSKSSQGYQSNDILYASQAYEFLQKWLMAHPKFMKNSLYIGGDSYSGKIVPLIVQKVSHGNFLFFALFTTSVLILSPK